jgi:YihY family inner membrane protein
MSELDPAGPTASPSTAPTTRGSRRATLFSARFAVQVVSRFLDNGGMLLAGSVAFYTILSLVTLFGLLLIGLSHLVSEERLLSLVSNNLELVVPGGATAIVAELKSFLQHREVASGVGLLVVLFFGSQAFSALDRAMAIIFRQRRQEAQRHFLTTLLIPYLFMGALAVGLLLVTGILAGLEAIARWQPSLLGVALPVGDAVDVAMHALRLSCELAMVSAIYIVLPGGRVRVRHALLGGAVATVLWEATRRVLVWYFENLSMVSVVYGSLATTIIAFLSAETAAVIVLLSAQVIAEYERLPRSA